MGSPEIEAPSGMSSWSPWALAWLASRRARDTSRVLLSAMATYVHIEEKRQKKDEKKRNNERNCMQKVNPQLGIRNEPPVLEKTQAQRTISGILMSPE
jgi:hypothetical protein